MALPSISEIARATAEPELRYTQQGTPVCGVRLAFNRSKLNEQTQKWENDRTFFIDGTLWKEAAERASTEITRGAEVFVSGEIETQQWEKDGEKRSKPVLQIRRFKVIPKTQDRPPRPSGQGEQWNSSAPAQDPWQGGGSQGGNDDPPF